MRSFFISFVLFALGILVFLGTAALLQVGGLGSRGSPGVVNEQAGAFLALVFLAAVLVCGVIAAAVAAVRGRGWRDAVWCASVGLTSLFGAQLIQLDAAALIAAVVSIVVIGFASRLQPKRPGAVFAVVVGTVVAGGLLVLGYVLVKEKMDLDALIEEEADDAALVRAAEQADTTALSALLASKHYAQDSSSAERSLVMLTVRGDHLAELEMIVTHANTAATPCVKFLRHVLRGEVAPLPDAPACFPIALYVAVRKRQTQLMPVLIEAVGGRDVAMDHPLTNLFDANDLGGVSLLLQALGLLDEHDRISAGLLSDAKVGHRVREQLQSPQRIAYFCEHADVDALLLGITATLTDDDASLVTKLIACGAHPDGRVDLGTTPLAAALWRENSLPVVKRLLAAHADPNKPGRRAHSGLGDLALVPLWILATRLGDKETSLDSEYFMVLLEAGADPKLRGPRRQSLLAFMKEQHSAYGEVVDEIARLEKSPRP